MSERDGYEPGVPCWVAAVEPDGGGMAVIADPSGAVFCLWQPGERKGAQVVNEPGAWSMSLLTTPDPDGATAFYGVLFGWETDTFDTGDGEITVWRLPGYVGGEPQQPLSRDVVGAMLSGDEHDGAPPPHWEVRFWIADADAAAGKAAARGGSVVAGPCDVAGFPQAVLADTQGAAFTVSQLMIASQGE